MPDDGTVVSPLDGTVTHISEEKHLYTITTADGVHILVHIGIGTVALNGEGIKPLVKVGESVKNRNTACRGGYHIPKGTRNESMYACNPDRPWRRRRGLKSVQARYRPGKM